MRLLISVLLFLSSVFTVIITPFVSGAADHAVILQYHHFGTDTPPSTSVTLKQFDAHLAYLHDNNFAVWPLDKIVSYLRDSKELPDKCIAITIDDAYKSVYEQAMPRLRKYNYPFTVFVPTGGVDTGIKSYMTWEEMRRMKEYGAEFSSHSNSHDYLIQKQPGESEAEWEMRVRKDIERSLRRVNEETGSNSRLFAYPYGEYNKELRKIVQDLNLTGLGQQSGAIWSGSDFAALPRFPMASHYADMEQFIPKVRSLPLPVISASPDNPVLPGDVLLPALQLRLKVGDFRTDSLACYMGGQGKINLEWKDRDKLIFEVRAKWPLPSGRSRYNCTALHKKENRYFWYSHLWIRPER